MKVFSLELDEQQNEWYLFVGTKLKQTAVGITFLRAMRLLELYDWERVDGVTGYSYQFKFI